MQNLGTQTGWSMTSEIKVHYFGQWDWNLNSNDIWIEAAKGAENFFSVTFWAKKKAICIPWHELGWFPFLRIFSKADRSSILSTRGCQPFEGTFSTNGFEKSLHIALQTRAENATTPRSISAKPVLNTTLIKEKSLAVPNCFNCVIASIKYMYYTMDQECWKCSIYGIKVQVQDVETYPTHSGNNRTSAWIATIARMNIAIAM